MACFAHFCDDLPEPFVNPVDEHLAPILGTKDNKESGGMNVETNKVLLHNIRNFVTQNILSQFLKREEFHIAYR